jgi:hypothetical protein
MSTNRFTTAKAALLYQGQAGRPHPSYTTAQAAFLHHGQTQPPKPQYVTAQAAFRHAKGAASPLNGGVTPSPKPFVARYSF